MRYELLNKICAHCGKVFTTTSRRDKVHPECRQEYYLSYQRKKYVHKRIISSKSNLARAREKYFINGQPCEACGFMDLTKKRSFLNEMTGKLEEFYLCPNCIALWRCGMMKAFSWERIPAEAPSATVTAQKKEEAI